LGLAAGTDFPCNDKEPLGNLLTYVKVDGKLNYYKWIAGIKKGNTVISRNGNKEFLDFTVNGKFLPGNNIPVSSKKKLTAKIVWLSTKSTRGTIELIRNGKIIASKSGTSYPGRPLVLLTTFSAIERGWIAARRMDSSEHISHSAPIYITKPGGPVPVSKADVLYFLQWVNNILNKIEPGGAWHKYFTNDFETVKARYLKAKEIYTKLLTESE
jgi:hypothetical protein